MIRGFEIVEDKYRKHPDCEIALPQRGTSRSAGYDLCTPVEIRIAPRGCSKIIFTDIKAYMLADEVVCTYVRSSIGMKKGLVLANTTGIIDSDYYSNPDNDGNLGVNLFNLGTTDYIIKKGDRIGQCMFINYLVADNGNTEDVRMGGFGSTNK